MTILKLDIDDKDALRAGSDLRFRVEFLNNLLNLEIKLEKLMETTNGFHAYLECNELSDAAIILVQTLLGSDWKREAFNLQRYSLDFPMDEYNVLFDKKYRMEKDKLILISEEKFGLKAGAFMLSYKAKRVLKRIKQFFHKSKNLIRGESYD